MRFVWGYTVMRLFGFYGGYGIGAGVFVGLRITLKTLFPYILPYNRKTSKPYDLKHFPPAKLLHFPVFYIACRGKFYALL